MKYYPTKEKLEKDDKKAQKKLSKDQDWYENQRGVYLRKLKNKVEELYDKNS